MIRKLAGLLTTIIPGEIVAPDPATGRPPRKSSTASRVTGLIGAALIIAGLYWMTAGSDRDIAKGAVGISAIALLWAIYLAVSLEKRIEIIMVDVRRIADAVTTQVRTAPPPEGPDHLPSAAVNDDEHVPETAAPRPALELHHELNAEGPDEAAADHDASR